MSALTSPSPSVLPTGPAMFDALYYATGCGRPYERNDAWLSFFNDIANRIVTTIQPATALDVGCAMGFLVEALHQHGVQAWGLDISEYAISQAHPSIRDFCVVASVTKPFTEPFDRRYDLIVCIEVLEHLSKADGEKAIANLCQHADDVLFSSSPSDFTEATHFNVQPAEYWAEQFARQNFFHDVEFDASFVTPWAMRFRRRSDPAPRIVRDYERQLARLQEENRQLRAALNDARSNSDVDTAQLRQERDALHDLVQRYEQGKFIRFMRWVKGAGQRQP